MYILKTYELYPLRLLKIFINACCWIIVDDVASISWIYALFACFIALIEIGHYNMRKFNLMICENSINFYECNFWFIKIL